MNRLSTRLVPSLGICLGLAAVSFPLAVTADSIIAFKAPNTHAGQQGGQGLVAHGEVHPHISAIRDPATVGRTSWPASHWRVGSAFFDAQLDAFVLGVDLADAGDWSSQFGFRYSSLLYGISTDGTEFGKWQEILWTNPEVSRFRIFNLSLRPAPGQPSVWQGFFAWTQVAAGSDVVVARGNARIDLDLSTSQVTIGDPNGLWQSFAVGSYLSSVPASAVDFPLHSLRSLDSQRVELWGSHGVPRSGHTPCNPPTMTYSTNTQAMTQGSRPSFLVYNLATEAVEQASRDLELGNLDNEVWTDYAPSLAAPPPTGRATSMALVPAYDLGTRLALYYGTADQRVCALANNWNPWAGSGVRFLRIVPTATGYQGHAAAYFLNVANPNWTCVPGVSQCYAADLRQYSFVGAYPLIPFPGSPEIFFYVESWGPFTIH